MAEAAVVRASIRELDKRRAWHFNVEGTGHNRNGLPDRMAVYRGHPIVIEFKAPNGRLRPLQRWELERARRAGAHVVIARHRDDVAAVLDLIDELADKGTPPPDLKVVA